jgi:hypothetical protein
VTNLPADLETLADAIDDTVKDLNPGTTAGDIDYYTSSTAKARLGIGTAGQVLAVNSGATAPEWTTPAAAGGMTLIATATPSAATSVSFTSIPTTYKELILVADSVFQSAGGGSWGVRLNNDSGTNYYEKIAAQSSTSIVNGSGSATYFGSQQQAGRFIPSDGPENGSDIANTINGVFHIQNANQTTGRKTVLWFSLKGSTLGGSLRSMGTYTGTSAISQIDLVRSSTQTITGTIRLYGIS